MNPDIIPTFLFLALFITFLCYFIILTLVQQHVSKSILKRFSSKRLRHITIRYSQSHDSYAIREGVPIPVKAEMYYNENLIIICPKRYGVFSSIFNLNMPIIITNDKTNTENLSNFHNVYRPDNVKLTKWNDLIINYHDWFISKIKYELTIQFINESDILTLSDLKLISTP